MPVGTAPASSGSTSTPINPTRSPATSRRDGTAGSRSCTREYLEYGLTIDGTVHRYGIEAEDYSTDVLADETEAFIRGSDGPRLRGLRPSGAA